jgi:hypothetical protein
MFKQIIAPLQHRQSRADGGTAAAGSKLANLFAGVRAIDAKDRTGQELAVLGFLNEPDPAALGLGVGAFSFRTATSQSLHARSA